MNLFKRGNTSTSVATASSSLLSKAKSGSALAAGKVPMPLFNVLSDVSNAVTDYLKVAQIETTKRTEITAKRDVALAMIQAQRANFSEMLKYTFEERAAVISKQFEALDHAIAQGNTALASTALDSMVQVVKSSPFKNLEDMQKQLGSKDFVARFE